MKIADLELEHEEKRGLAKLAFKPMDASGLGAFIGLYSMDKFRREILPKWIVHGYVRKHRTVLNRTLYTLNEEMIEL